jgi:deazaflavin-dependent oxidoreductase (nitroreductase family)
MSVPLRYAIGSATSLSSRGIVPAHARVARGEERERIWAKREAMSDRNDRITEEFRANEGRVGGYFEGRTLLLLHHRGAKTGTERVNPLGYQRLDDDSVAVFGSAGGSTKTPDWYYNLVAHPDVTVEIGTETFPAHARVARREERERIWAKQKRDWSGFADYEEKLRDIREIPVVVLEKA